VSSLLLAFAVVVAAQAGDAPPPPLDELPAPVTPRDDDDDDDDDDADRADAPPVLEPAQPVQPVQPKRGSPAPRRATPAPDVEPEGLDPFLVGAMQWGVPCATAVVAAPCVLLAVYGCPAVVCVPCVLPAANGYLAAYVGDRFGKSRAPAIWPVLAAYAAGLVTSVAVIAAFLVASPALGNGLTDPVVIAGLSVSMLVTATASVLVPVAYALTAEPKRPGDDGSEVPGWFAPNHPTTKPRKKSPTREPVDAPPRLTAMLF
jgi:hypothetical protein